MDEIMVIGMKIMERIIIIISILPVRNLLNFRDLEINLCLEEELGMVGKGSIA